MFEALKTFFSKRFARRPVDRQAHTLYVAAVDAARQQALFVDGGVADTLDGRFDMIILHLALVMERLRQITPEGPEGADARELETRILEVHFADMDQALREMGVGDLGVGKRVKAMAKAYMGRRLAYGAALEALDSSGSRSDLEQALTRNAYRGEAPGPQALQWLGDYVVRQREALAAQPLDAFMAGTVTFFSGQSLTHPDKVYSEDPIMTSRTPTKGEKPELSRLVTEEMLAREAYTVDIDASEDERAALARRFSLLAVDCLKVRIKLTSRGKEVLLEGNLDAQVTQACVVTLDPVHSTIASRFSVRYMSPDDFAEHVVGEEEEAFLDPESEDIEPLPEHGIDVGEVASQYLMLALDPYPRKEGTDLGAVGSDNDDAEARENPFAVLKKLQDRG